MVCKDLALVSKPLTSLNPKFLPNMYFGSTNIHKKSKTGKYGFLQSVPNQLRNSNQTHKKHVFCVNY